MDPPKALHDVVWQRQRQELRRTAKLVWASALLPRHSILILEEIRCVKRFLVGKSSDRQANRIPSARAEPWHAHPKCLARVSMRMRRMVGRVLPVVLVLVLGVCIGGPALDPEFEPLPHHYDGDADDAGHIGKVFSHWVDTAVTDTPLTVIPSALTQCWAPSVPLRPPQIAHEPLRARPPPA
jgi:hypothetical protein